MGSAPDGGGADRQIAEIATTQHAVIGSSQLRTLGLSRNAIAHRVRRGRLHPLRRGVYAVGHRVVGQKGHWMAAVLAVGGDAVLSHRSAAALLELRPSSRTAVDVTTSRRAHSREGIDVHHVRRLPERDVTRIDEIPCTTVARSLLDLAEVVHPHDVQRALERAEINGQFDLHAIQDVIARHPTRRGAARLRQALSAYDPEMERTASELEREFVVLCRRCHLPPPAINAPVSLRDGGTVIVDALWRTERLAVELDGHASHGTRQAFERDRRRDAKLMLIGFRVVRFTWRQVTRDPAGVAETIRRLLASG